MQSTPQLESSATRRVRSTRKWKPPAKYQRVRRREILGVGEKPARTPRPYPQGFIPPMVEVGRGRWAFDRPAPASGSARTKLEYRRKRAPGSWEHVASKWQPWEPRP